MVILRLKTAFADWLKPEERDIINAIDDGKIHTVKITTENSMFEKIEETAEVSTR